MSHHWIYVLWPSCSKIFSVRGKCEPTCQDRSKIFFFKKYVAEIFPIFSLSIIPEINTRWGGIVEADYRGNIHVILINLSNNRVDFNTGDRIAQVLFQKKKDVVFEEVSSFKEDLVVSLLQRFRRKKKEWANL